MSEKSRGFMYLGKADCGCITGMTWDDPEYKKSTAKFIAMLIRRGDAVTRVEVFEGEPTPDHECETHAAERAERAASRAKATQP